METEKKQWTKPELIVLVRNKPEEAVLATCKMFGVGGPGNSAINLIPSPIMAG
jgi:hypothetical protein